MFILQGFGFQLEYKLRFTLMAVPGHRITRRRSKFSIFGTHLLGVDLLSMRFRLTVTCTLSLLYYSIILLNCSSSTKWCRSWMSHFSQFTDASCLKILHLIFTVFFFFFFYFSYKKIRMKSKTWWMQFSKAYLFTDTGKLLLCSAKELYFWKCSFSIHLHSSSGQ